MTILRRNPLACLPAALLLLLSPVPGRAQDDVMRDVYGFYGSSLDVEVAADGAGQIRFLRGQRSRIEVAGRSPNGFTTAALGGRGARRLTLTALGGERADFVVVVPEDVRVRILWPGTRRSEQFGTLSRTATFAWDAIVHHPMIESVRPGSATGTGTTTGTRVALASTPRLVDVRSAHLLDRLTIRVEGEEFSISASVPIVTRTTSQGLSFDAPAGADVTIVVPSDDAFSVALDGIPAIDMRSGDVRVLCESVLSQTLPDGSRWLTLTPVPRGGCSPPAPDGPRGTETVGARRT